MRAFQMSIAWKGAAPLCSARYNELAVNCPEGSNFHLKESGSVEGETALSSTTRRSPGTYSMKDRVGIKSMSELDYDTMLQLIPGCRSVILQNLL
uniref:Uncharacterized protein n=1 Tax=Hordeum vulgare subsp. vulgare TaxID=112509 RepID=A0A8I6X3A0_HORVV